MISYFSNDENRRAKYIFDLIAPVYGLIDRSTKKNYREIAALLDREIPLEGRSVLDIGTGTGAWIAALNACGASRTSSKIPVKSEIFCDFPGLMA